MEDSSAIKVLKLRAGLPFVMGGARSRRIIYPEMGATHLTLNYGVHEPGVEFAQHIHEHSEDVIVCLEGGGAVRSGSRMISFTAGDAIFVPAGVIHGTINTGHTPLVMISCQASPDPKLYRQKWSGPGDEATST